MAQKYIAIKTSDLSGAELAGGEGDTITFSVGRSNYVIDLTDEEVGAFYDVLKPYTDAARKGEGISSPSSRSSRSSAPKQDLGAVREWANANGHPVSSRGRIPSTVMSAYEAAH